MVDSWSEKEYKEYDFCWTPQWIDNNNSEKRKRKLLKNVEFKKRKVIKKKKDNSNNIKNSNNDGFNYQSSYSIRKAVTIAISFEMIKEVKTLDIISTNIVNEEVDFGLINSIYTVGIFSLVENASRSYLTAYNIMIIVFVKNIDNIRNSPLTVGIVFLRCLYPQRQAGTFAVI
jgi:hypothetical protein